MNVGRMNNLSKEQLISFIEDRKIEIFAHYEAICEAIWELDTRCKYKHPLAKDQLCKFYKEVRNGTLTVAMVFALAGQEKLLAHMVGRPTELQNDWASGRLIPVCRIVRGEVVEVKLAMQAFEQRDLQVAFPIGKSPTTLSEQRAALMEKLAKAAATPAPSVRPSLSIKNGRVTAMNFREMSLDDFITLCREAGLDVKVMEVA